VRARVVASAGMAALLAAVLAGCNFLTPTATLKPYDPSDGVSTVVGDVHVLNALILSDDGEDGNLIFSAVNESGGPVRLTVQFDSAGTKTDLTLPLDDGSNDFGFGEQGQLLLAAIDAQPGGVVPIYFQYGSEQGKQLDVPVLDGTLEQYAPFLPTPVPTVTAGATPTPTPTP